MSEFELPCFLWNSQKSHEGIEDVKIVKNTKQNHCCKSICLTFCFLQWFLCPREFVLKWKVCLVCGGWWWRMVVVGGVSVKDTRTGCSPEDGGWLQSVIPATVVNISWSISLSRSCLRQPVRINPVQEKRQNDSSYGNCVSKLHLSGFDKNKYQIGNFHD